MLSPRVWTSRYGEGLAGMLRESFAATGDASHARAARALDPLPAHRPEIDDSLALERMAS